MSNPQSDPLMQVETTCGSLLYELQVLFEFLMRSNSLFLFLFFISFPLLLQKQFEILLNVLLAENDFFLIYFQTQIIWDEVGESDTDRDKMLLELEQEC